MSQDEGWDGYLYVMRGLGDRMNEIKVGFSKDPSLRSAQLHNSGSIWKMVVFRQWAVENMRKAENAAHHMLAPRRFQDRREFFQIAPMPHYSLEERMNDEISDSLLHEIGFCIEDAMSQADLAYQRVEPKPYRP